MTFEEFMNKKFKGWKIQLNPDEVEVYKNIYDEISKFRSHYNNLLDSYAPESMINGVEISIQHLQSVLEHDIKRNMEQSYDNVSRETYIARSI